MKAWDTIEKGLIIGARGRERERGQENAERPHWESPTVAMSNTQRRSGGHLD
jgi:hypothetical protein